MKTRYMHTLDGKPAEYCDGVVCFSSRRIKLVDSLKQIRREQRKSMEWDAARNNAGVLTYGYVTVIA